MTTTRWTRFEWKTTSLLDFPELKKPFSIRPASLAEKEEVDYVALRALKMNTEWNDDFVSAMKFIKKGVEQIFAPESDPSALVMTHGQRVIGISLFDVRAEASLHLLSGPWVLMEYRNRGLGSSLLHATLHELSQRGVTTASGITRAKTTADRYVYPKFGGVKSENYLFEESKNS